MLTKLLRVAQKILPPKFFSEIIRAGQAKFTASAAAVIVNDKREVLLLEHILRPFAPWGLPGGFLSWGEQPDDGVRREIREETGVELESLELFCVRTLGRHIEFIFTATASTGPTINSSEIRNIGWFAPARFPDGFSRA